MEKNNGFIYGLVLVFLLTVVFLHEPITNWVMARKIENLRANGQNVNLPVEGEVTDFSVRLENESRVEALIYSILIPLCIILVVVVFIQVKNSSTKFIDNNEMILDEKD